MTVGYYSRQLDTAGNTLFDYYSRSSFDGGTSFNASVRMSDVSSAVVLDSELATCYHGDYDTQVPGAGVTHYVWSDDRDSGGATPNVWTDVTPAGTDFLPIPQQASQAVCAPNDGVYPIDVLKFQTFAESVTLSATGNPAGTMVGFSPNGQVPPFSSTMTVDVTGAASAGSSTITVTGTSNPTAIVHSTPVELTIYTVAPAAPALTSPADGAIDTVRSPLLTWAAVPDTVDYLVEVATDAGFTSIVRSRTVTSPTWAVSPALAIDTLHYWRVTASNPCGAAPSGTFGFRTAIPSILLVDDDDNAPDVAGTYQAMVNGVGAAFDVWETTAAGGEPTLNDLKPYRAVIWFAGDRYCGATTPCAGPQAAGEAELAKHLGSGRCLLIASQDYLYDMGGGTTDTPTAFMTGYLGVAATGSVSDTGGYTRVDGENVYAALADSTLTIPGGYGEYADLLAAGNGGQTAFRGDLPAGNTRVGGVSKLGPTHFTTYLGFGLELLTPGRQAEVLDQFLATCNGEVPLFSDDFELGNRERWSLAVTP